MSKIQSVTASQILDSRGNPTIETRVVLADGTIGISSVPSGASVSTYEAVELRDGDPKNFNGLGVSKAIETIKTVIAPAISGIEVFEQAEIDRKMIEIDGTQNKGRLGGNSMLSVSQAVSKAAAKSSLMPLSLYLRQFVSAKEQIHKIPTPMFNVLEGGKHARNTLDFQEFLVVPASSKSYADSLHMGAHVHRAVVGVLKERNVNRLYADEGGFGPDLATNAEGLIILKEAIERAGFSFSLDIFLGIDAAANSYKDGKSYKIHDRAIPYNTDEFVEFYETLFNDFSLMYIEDPFAEDDWEAWKKIYKTLAAKTLIVGDDLIATNPYRLQLAFDNEVVNGIVIKPNQIGTITEAIAVIEIARYKNLKIIVSSRSGETGDHFISDFAVAVGADYVKFGAPARERVIKYNRLLNIQSEIERFTAGL